MITDFNNKTAVLTGAGSGFGLECARIGARLGMNLVLVDVQQDALDRAAQELQAAGAPVLAQRVDVSNGAAMDALGQAVQARRHFGPGSLRIERIEGIGHRLMRKLTADDRQLFKALAGWARAGGRHLPVLLTIGSHLSPVRAAGPGPRHQKTLTS